METNTKLIENIKRGRITPTELFIHDLFKNIYIKNGNYLKLVYDKKSNNKVERIILYHKKDSQNKVTKQMIIDKAYVIDSMVSKFKLTRTAVKILIRDKFNEIYGTDYPQNYFY